jgi:RNA 3'-terminal phosphate cyclase (ATP)
VAGSHGPGNVVFIEIESEHITEVFTGFGQRGVRAETVAERAVNDARTYLAAGVPVGEHLADQLLIPMALAGGGAFVTQSLTRHTETNAEVIRRFLDMEVASEPLSPGVWRVDVRRSG